MHGLVWSWPHRWVAGALLLCMASPAMAAEYTFRKLLEAPDWMQQLYGPSLNDHGAVAFTAFLDDGTIGAYAVTPGGSLVTLADSSTGHSVLEPMIASINNFNTVAYAARASGQPFTAIYRHFSFGERLVFTQTSATQGGFYSLNDPWIGNSNAVVYDAGIRPTEDDPISRRALMLGSIPLVTGPADTTTFQWPDINSIDSVVVVGNNGLYLNSIAVYQHAGSSASINDAGTVAFLADDYGPLGIYTGNGIDTPTLYAAATGGTAMAHPDINNDGLIVYLDREFGGRERIFVGTGHERLLNGGLFGSGVTEEQFFRGLNNRSQIAFAYELSNGERGIALATPRDPAVLGNGDFNNGLGLFEVIDDQSDGFAFTPNVAGDPRLQMTTTTGVLGLHQRMETTDEPYLLQFDFDWLTDAGSLEVIVNDVLALTLGADGSIGSPLGLPAVQSAGDLTRVSLVFMPAEVEEGYIRFDLHPGSEATIQLDNIVFAPVPEPATGLLLLGVTGAWFTGRFRPHPRRGKAAA